MIYHSVYLCWTCLWKYFFNVSYEMRWNNKIIVLNCFLIWNQAAANYLEIKNEVSLTRKLYNLRPMTNPLYSEKEAQNTASHATASNRNYLGNFREILWNQITDVHQGTIPITRVITWLWRYITWGWRYRNHANTITSVIAAKQTVINEIYVCVFQ